MQRPWIADRNVDAALARELVEARFPKLAPAAVEPYGEGWDNVAFRVNGEWIFRFSRREVADALLRSEIAILPHLADRLPVPVPTPELVGAPVPQFEAPWAGYRELPGRTADRAAPDAAARARLAGPLGRLLASLHAIGADEARPWGAGGDAMGKLVHERMRAMTAERLGHAEREGWIASAGPWVALFDDWPDREVRADTLVHGDLYSRHLLLDDAFDLCGVIDWGDVHVGDPALDLALAWEFLPRAARGDFRKAYGPIDDATWRVARARAAQHAALELVYGKDVGDRALAAEGRRALDHVLDA